MKTGMAAAVLGLVLPGIALADESRVNIASEGGAVRIDLSPGEEGRQVVLEARRFLEDNDDWNPILRLHSAASGRAYYDPLCRVNPIRFYRLRHPRFPETSWADNFKLLDSSGEAHELFYHTHVPVIVLVVLGDSLDRLQGILPEMRQIGEEHGEDVRFWAIQARGEFDRKGIQAFREERQLDFPVLLDAGGVVTRNLGPSRLPEIFAVRSSDWTIFYRGAMSTEVAVGEAMVTNRYLQDALVEQFAREPITVQMAEPTGEPSGLPEQVPVSYAEEIAPILTEHCIGCHSEGNIAPFALDSHQAVAQYAWPIKDQVMSGRMPPWHADEHVGSFENATRLSQGERNALVTWINQGAPRGDGEDPLERTEVPRPEWVLGEPDYIVEIPRQDVPAEGVVDYRYISVDNPVPHDTWLRSATVIPGDAEVVHHSLVFLVSEPEDLFAVQGGLAGFFAGYVPGLEPEFYPENTGKFLPAGAAFIFQQHYTPNGRATTDVTRLGLYLADEPPEMKLVTASAFTTNIQIPPRERHVPVSVSNRIWQDSWLIELNPHMHYRGRTARYRAVFPDGGSRDLLSVPFYHFDWQRSYRLREPLFLPAGTVIEVTGSFDNSPQNRWNPDPDQSVRFGEQSWDEMFIGYFNYAVPNE